MHRGYFPLWRKFFEDHPFWKEKRKFSRAEAWIDILINTNHKNTPVERLVNGKLVSIGYGECVMTTRYCGRRWGWHKSSVHDFLGLLKKMAQIRTSVELGMTKITVINFRQYDTRESINSDTEVNTARTLPGHCPDKLKNLRTIEDSLRSSSNSCPEMASPSSELQAVVVEVPLIPRDGLFKITQEMIDSWTADFPGIDVSCELHKIRQWNISNPKRRKTRGGIKRHIVAWLGKAQDRSRATPAQRAPTPFEQRRAERENMVDFVRAMEKRQEDILNGSYKSEEGSNRPGAGAIECPKQIQ